MRLFLQSVVEYYTIDINRVPKLPNSESKMEEKRNLPQKNDLLWWVTIVVFVVIISSFHYTTSTMKWQYHLVFMQAYFIPILIAALQFGIQIGRAHV